MILYYIQFFVVFLALMGIFSIPVSLALTEGFRAVSLKPHAPRELLAIIMARLQFWRILWLGVLAIIYGYSFHRFYFFSPTPRILLSFYFPVTLVDDWLLSFCCCLILSDRRLNPFLLALLSSLAASIAIVLINGKIIPLLPFSWTHYVPPASLHSPVVELWSFLTFPPCLLAAAGLFRWWFRFVTAYSQREETGDQNTISPEED